MENKEVTLKEAIEMVATNLGEICVPMKEIETIGKQIAREINNLKMIANAITEQEQKDEQKKDEESEQAEVQEDA